HSGRDSTHLPGRQAYGDTPILWRDVPHYEARICGLPERSALQDRMCRVSRLARRGRMDPEQNKRNPPTGSNRVPNAAQTDPRRFGKQPARTGPRNLRELSLAGEIRRRANARIPEIRRGRGKYTFRYRPVDDGRWKSDFRDSWRAPPSRSSHPFRG